MRGYDSVSILARNGRFRLAWPTTEEADVLSDEWRAITYTCGVNAQVKVTKTHTFLALRVLTCARKEHHTSKRHAPIPYMQSLLL